MTTESKIIKTCYTHLGGKFSMLLMENFIEKGWIKKEKTSKKFIITTEGEKAFTKMGIDLSKIK